MVEVVGKKQFRLTDYGLSTARTVAAEMPRLSPDRQ